MRGELYYIIGSPSTPEILHVSKNEPQTGGKKEGSVLVQISAH